MFFIASAQLYALGYYFISIISKLHPINYTPGVENPLFYSLRVSLTLFKLSVQCFSKGAAMKMRAMSVMIIEYLK